MNQNWHEVGPLSAFEDEEPVAVKVAGKEIGVYLIDGQVHAIEDVCPHAYALLSQGFVEGDQVECPLHGAIFHIPSGKCLAEPGGRDLKIYKTRIEAGIVFVEPLSAE